MNLVAVIPAHHPSPALVESVGMLMVIGVEVIAVDDGSGSDADAVLHMVVDVGAKVIRSPSNQGIAHALNVGVKAALGGKADYVMTLDQDSQPHATYVRRAIELLETEPERAAVVPEFTGNWRQPVRRFRGRGDGTVPLEPIQSGAIFRAEVFDEVGYFREEFFIDAVDTDFFHRMRRRGLRTGIVGGGRIEHQLGEPHWVAKVGVSVNGHSPVRRYYMARNRAILFAEVWDDPEWWLRQAWGESRFFVRELIASPDPLNHLRATWFGIRDALAHCMGPISPTSEQRLCRSRN